MPKLWRIANHDHSLIEAMERGAAVPPVVARMLLCRGVHSVDAARAFLKPTLKSLRDPALLPGVTEAVERIHAAIAASTKIVVYGDYDADGITATAILVRCLRLLGAQVSHYVPHRIDEGYGLNNAALDELKARGAGMIITVDNGVASVGPADHARKLGLELIVTDHHQFADRLPNAAAIVHPALPGSNYPFAGLCGAAVAFKLAWALCQATSDATRVSERLRRYLLRAVGLAAIGTVADVVPLIDENRALVTHGLRALREDPLPGVAALEVVCQTTEKPVLGGEDIGFSLAPRLNAAARLGQADLAIELLTTDDLARADELARFINELNEQRQSIERSVLLAARKQAKDEFRPDTDPALVLAGHDWHPGVIGIVAGKLAEQYHKPVVVASLDKLGIRPATASGRSVPGFDLAAAFAECREHLISHGGHRAAAGLKIDPADLEAFRIDFCAAAAAQADEMGAGAELLVDAETPLAALTHQTVSQIEQLAPFGHGNRRPVLCTTGVTLASPAKTMGAAGRHLSLEIIQHGVKLRAVAFGAGDRQREFADPNEPMAIAFKPIINTFRGWAKVEVHLEDWRHGDAPLATAAPASALATR